MVPTLLRSQNGVLVVHFVALVLSVLLISTSSSMDPTEFKLGTSNSSMAWAEDTHLDDLEGRKARKAARYYLHRFKRMGTVQDCIEDEVAYICTGTCVTRHEMEKFPHGFLQFIGFRHDSLTDILACTVDGKIFVESQQGKPISGVEYMKFTAEREKSLRAEEARHKILLHTFAARCPFISYEQAQQVIGRTRAPSRENAPALLWRVHGNVDQYRIPVYDVRYVNTEKAKGVGMMAGPLFGSVDLKEYVDYYQTRWNVERFYIYTTDKWSNPDPKWFAEMQRRGTITCFQLTAELYTLYYNGQILAQNTALWDAKSEFKYLLCFDPDEFLDWNFPPPTGISIQDPLLRILDALNGTSVKVPWITYEIDEHMMKIDERPPSIATPEGFRPLQYPFDTSTSASICHYQGKPIIRTRVSYYSTVHHTYQLATEQKIFSLGHYRHPIDILVEHSGKREVRDNAFVRIFPSVDSCEVVLDWWDRHGMEHPDDWEPSAE